MGLRMAVTVRMTIHMTMPVFFGGLRKSRDWKRVRRHVVSVESPRGGFVGAACDYAPRVQPSVDMGAERSVEDASYFVRESYRWLYLQSGRVQGKSVCFGRRRCKRMYCTPPDVCSPQRTWRRPGERSDETRQGPGEAVESAIGRHRSVAAPD